MTPQQAVTPRSLLPLPHPGARACCCLLAGSAQNFALYSFNHFSITKLIPVHGSRHWNALWKLFWNLDIQNSFFFIKSDEHFTNAEIKACTGPQVCEPGEANCPFNFCISDFTQLAGSAFWIVLLFCYHGSHNILLWQTSFLPQDRHPHPAPSKDNGNYFPENWTSSY